MHTCPINRISYGHTGKQGPRNSFSRIDKSIMDINRTKLKELYELKGTLNWNHVNQKALLFHKLVIIIIIIIISTIFEKIKTMSYISTITH